MKRYVLAAAFGLPIVLMPMSVSAQQSEATEIVVTAKYQKDWDKGSALEAKGLAALEKAQKNLIKHSADVVSAENKRSSSDARAINAEQEFRRLTVQSPVFTSAREADAWAKRVAEAAAEWEKYSKRSSDGSEDFAEAVKRKEKAQAEVNKAEAQIAKGREMKAAAERMSRLQN